MSNTSLSKRIFEKVILMIFLGLLTALVLLQANPMTTPLGRDSGSFAYIGHTILEGKLPYVDAWDSKPPGIFYIDAAALQIGQGTRWGIWFVEFLFLYASAGIGYWLMRKLWKSGAAIFATLLWIIGLNLVLSGGNFTEEYPLLFNFLALFWFWGGVQKPGNRMYDFLIGLTLGMSFLFRANNIGVQISIFLTWCVIMLAGKKYGLLVKKTAAMCAGVLLVIAATCSYFWAKGILGQMVEAALLYNFSYSGQHANLWQSFKAGFNYLGPVAWGALIGYVFVLRNLILGIFKSRSLDWVTLLVVIGWPVEIVLSGLSGRGYGHYFISWLPMIALIYGMMFSILAPQIFLPKVIAFLNEKTRLTLLVLAVSAGIIFSNGVKDYWHTFSKVLFNRGSGVELVDPTAQYSRENTQAGDTVLVWGGQAGLNFLSRRDSPTPYLFYPLYVNSPYTEIMETQFLSDLKNNPPALIIDAYVRDPDNVLSINPDIRAAQIAAGKGLTYQPFNLEQVFDFIQSNYHLETTIGDYSIYIKD